MTFGKGSKVYFEPRDETGVVERVIRREDGDICLVSFPGGTQSIRTGHLTLADNQWDCISDTCLRDLMLKRKAVALDFAYTHDDFVSLSNSRLEPMPHQVFVVHRVTQDLFPRYILADEVGLGKTIEAGMVLKELKARELAERVLIIPPGSLTTQWRWEMSNKFNENFLIVDGDYIRNFKHNNPDANVWEHTPQAIASLHLLRRDEHREELAQCTKGWDLIIFDEAHHLRNYEKDGKTKSYRLGETMERKTDSNSYAVR